MFADIVSTSRNDHGNGDAIIDHNVRNTCVCI